jgi:hypothetical protein
MPKGKNKIEIPELKKNDVPLPQPPQQDDFKPKERKNETYNPYDPSSRPTNNPSNRPIDKQEEEKEGGTIIDAIKNPIATVKEAFNLIPTKFNNQSRRVLEADGTKNIIKIVILKMPVSSKIEGTINAISFGGWNKLKEKNGFKTMYHLGLLLTLAGGTNIIVEKNEVVDIHYYAGSSYATKKDIEQMNVPLHNNNLTLEQFVNNCINYMGQNNYFDYQAFKYNCQNFCLSNLTASHLANQSIKDFVLQDLTKMNKDIQTSNFSYLPKVVNGVTKMGSFFSRLMGKGQSVKLNDEHKKAFNKIIADYNFKKEDLKYFNSDFLHDIQNNRFNFI